MASHAAPAPLDEAYIRGLWESLLPTGPLPGVFLMMPQRESGHSDRAFCYLVKIRSGGFMIAAPDVAEVGRFLEEQQGADGQELCAIYQTEALMETNRGRALGEGALLLVDLPWELSRLFIKVHSLRNPASYDILRFTVGDQPCRPRRSALIGASDHWVHEVMDDDAAGDYVTGDSEGLEPGWEQTEAVDLGEAPSDELGILRQRVQELETQLQQHVRPPSSRALETVPKASPARPTGRGVLFDGPPTHAGPSDVASTLAKLQGLAGSAPMRLGAHERQRAASQSHPGMEALQQEAGLEAIEEAEVEDGLQQLEGALTDPMQKLMYLQMRQMAMLSKQQAQLTQSKDPISAALSGGSESQSTGNAGIKGCMAREAYVKLLTDARKVATVVAENAATELGLEVTSIGPGLMRDYVEKRSPLGENRALIQQAYMWAWAWETGFRSGNVELMAVASRGLVYVDQTAMDMNRTKLSWLLTGLPEPQYSICQKNKQANTLSPFSRLAAPSWVGANVAFLKDLDFLEGKIKAAAGPKPQTNVDQGSEDAAPRKPWRPKKKKAAGGNASSDSTAN